jgi:heme A synthase
MVTRPPRPGPFAIACALRVAVATGARYISRTVAFARYAWGVLACNLAVMLWGAFVRATGSGAGCGARWPDCNGEIIPRPENVETATAIELTHRITSGLALLLVVVLYAWARRKFVRGHPARRAAGASLALILVEAAIGAGIVLLKLVGDDASAARAVWSALHLVNTFLLIGALALSAWWGAENRAPARLDPRGGTGWLVGIGALALLLTGTTGAITALGDTLFPARSLAEGLAQDLSATAHFLVRLRVIHPVIATLSFVYLLMASGMLAMQRPDPRVRRGAFMLVATMVAQIGVGLVDVALLAPVGIQLVHLLLADMVWIALVLLGASALAAPRAREIKTPLPARA